MAQCGKICLFQPICAAIDCSRDLVAVVSRDSGATPERPMDVRPSLLAPSLRQPSDAFSLTTVRGLASLSKSAVLLTAPMLTYRPVQKVLGMARQDAQAAKLSCSQCAQTTFR